MRLSPSEPIELPEVHRDRFLRVMSAARHQVDPAVHWEEFVELVWHGLYPEARPFHGSHGLDEDWMFPAQDRSVIDELLP